MNLNTWSCHVILFLTLNPNLISGFLFWPFNSHTERSSENSQQSKSLFGSIFPSFAWNRAPVLGISAYKSIDLGDTGELRNDFLFRIGPKPKVITNEIDETLEYDPYTSHGSNPFNNAKHGQRYGRAEHQDWYYKNDIPSYRDFPVNENDNLMEVENEFLQSPMEKQISPRYEYQPDPPKEFTRTLDHALTFQVVTPKPGQKQNGGIDGQFRQARFEYSNLVSSENHHQKHQNEHLNMLTQEDNIKHQDSGTFERDYINDYPNYNGYQDQDYYYHEQQLPGHIVFKK